jgi:predicted permease
MPGHGRRVFRFPWRSREAIASDLETELRFHLDMRTAELVAQGIPKTEARMEAEREFGDMERTRRYCQAVDEGGERGERRSRYLDEVRQHLVFAWRALRRSPGFAVVALLTLALGIGANTAIFSVVNGVFLRPLPYADPDRLVAVYEHNVPEHMERSEMSPADVVDYRSQQTALAGLAAYGYGEYTYHPPAGDAVLLEARRVSANMFNVLGARPALGRTFAPDEDTPAKKHVVVLSDGVWRRLFGADAAVVGRAITLDDQPFTVIGVMPPGFTLGFGEGIWTPLDLTNVLEDVNRSRKFHFLFSVGRLKPGVTLESARANLLTIARRLEAEYPDANSGHLVTVLPLHAAMAGQLRPTLLVLMAAAVVVLLIACSNMANVMLSRAIGRRRELAIRVALGAGRARVVRQLLSESILVAVLGGTVGVLAAYWGTGALLALNPAALPPFAHVGVDGRVLFYTIVLSLGSGVVFGLVPAVTESAPETHSTLKESDRGTAGGGRSSQMRRVLIVTQTALAVVLLVGAGLLIRSLGEIQHVSMGFDPEHVLTAQVSLGGKRYDSLVAINQFYDRVIGQVARTRGIERVGVVGGLPLRGSSTASLAIEGRAAPPGRLPEVGYVVVAGDYFQALRVPLVRGRFLERTDQPKAPPVTLINDAMARRYWGSDDPVGKRIRIGPDPAAPWITVVGVVGDVRQMGLTMDPRPTVFIPNQQDGWPTLTFVIRTTGAPEQAVPVLRAAVRDADPGRPITAVRTMVDVIGQSLAQRRFSMLLLVIFAGVALVLAAIGVYGALAYSVAARTRELGVRMALGASARDVLALVVRQGLGWSILGVALGVVGARIAGRLIEGLLYGVRPTDVETSGAVAVIVAVVALVACVVPARRATRVDPVEALRAE